MDMSVFMDQLDKPFAKGCLLLPEGVEVWKPKEKGTHAIVILPYKTTDSPYVPKGELFWMRDYYKWTNLPVQGHYINNRLTFKERNCAIEDEIRGVEFDEKHKPRCQRLCLMNVWFPDTDEVKLMDFSFANFAKPFISAYKYELEDPDNEYLKAFCDPAGPAMIRVGFVEDSVGKTKFYPAQHFKFKPYKAKDGSVAIPQEILAKVVDLDALLDRKTYETIQAEFNGATPFGEGKETEAPPKGRASTPAPAAETEEEAPASPPARKPPAKPKAEPKAPVVDDADPWDADDEDWN